MFKQTFITITLFFLLESTHATLKKPIDLAFLTSIFTNGLNTNEFNTIKIGYSTQELNAFDSLNTNNNNNIELISFYLEEQCLSECLRNSYCNAYLFNTTSNLCKIRIANQKRRIDDFEQEILDKINNELAIDLLKCSQGVNCFQIQQENKSNTSGSSSINSSSVVSQPICDVNVSNGPNCEYQIKYEYSEWSAWSMCSQLCEGGIMRRTRVCLKTSYDNIQAKLVTTTTTSEQSNLNCNQLYGPSFELKECNTQACGLYTEWSQWSACDNFCFGLRKRTRKCASNGNNDDKQINELCNEMYLSETETCGNDCASLSLRLVNPTTLDTNTSAPILLAGIVQFINLKTKSPIRLLTNTNVNASIERIGQVACNEFGFNGLNWAQAKLAMDLPKTKQEYDTFIKINKGAYTGLECKSGDEMSLKECDYKYVEFNETLQFDIEIDCLVNGYWSEWSEWSACSTTCGAGIRQRQRFCTNPSPSQSTFKNGLPCADRASQKEQCTMQRCRAPVGPIPAAAAAAA